MHSTDKMVIDFLQKPKTLLVVGASNKEYRAGHYVPKFLKQKGFKIIPVNPNEITVFGEKSRSSVEDVREEYDGAIIYRNSQAAKNIALELIQSGKIDYLWFPDNVTSKTVARLASDNGVTFIEDRCPLRDYKRFIENKVPS